MILMVYLIGVILTFLAMYWSKTTMTFRTPYDLEGVKVLVAFFWPVIAFTLICHMVSATWEHLLEQANADDKIGKLCVKLGNLYRKFAK